MNCMHHIPHHLAHDHSRAKTEHMNSHRNRGDSPHLSRKAYDIRKIDAQPMHQSANCMLQTCPVDSVHSGQRTCPLPAMIATYILKYIHVHTWWTPATMNNIELLLGQDQSLASLGLTSHSGQLYCLVQLFGLQLPHFL